MKVKRSAGNEISADIHVPSDSAWFDGHFPDDPILPGVAQIGMVFDAIRKSQNRDLKVSNVRRVRFKQIIRPADQIKIIATPQKKDDSSYSFRILVKDEKVCSGIMKVEQLKK